MPTVIHQRCFNHAEREAVARCPVCHQYFCRECITEHEERVICAACLRKLAGTDVTRSTKLATAGRFFQFAMGILLAWFFFYLVGEALLAMPTSFHESTLWQGSWLDGD